MPSLAALRRRHLMSQRALAQKAGVSPATLVAIERGTVRPAYRTMAKVAAALGIDPLEVDEFRRAIDQERNRLAA